MGYMRGCDLIAVLLPMVLLMGCWSVTLPTITNADQRRMRLESQLPVTEVDSLAQLTRVVVQKTDGEQLKAVYIGTGQALEEPSEVVLLLSIDGGGIQIPAREVRWIRPAKRSTVLHAVLLGAVIDAVLLYAVFTRKPAPQSHCCM